MSRLTCSRAALLAALLMEALSPQQALAAAKNGAANAAAAQREGTSAAAGTGAAATAAPAATTPLPLWQHYESLFPADLMIPTVARMRDHEVLYQIPRHPRALVFFVPGCAHSARDWWPHSVACPTCLGLPEEMGQTQQALGRGYAGVLYTLDKN